jgi:hypothetical protein
MKFTAGYSDVLRMQSSRSLSEALTEPGAETLHEALDRSRSGLARRADRIAFDLLGWAGISKQLKARKEWEGRGPE